MHDQPASLFPMIISFILGILAVAVGYHDCQTTRALERTTQARYQAEADLAGCRKLERESQVTDVIDTLYPCIRFGGPYVLHADVPESGPSHTWCEGQWDKLAPRPPAERRPSFYTVEDCTGPIDTKGEPRVHGSWVYGGDCEELAHTFRDGPEKLCQGYVDDDPKSAEACRSDLKSWITKMCNAPEYELDDSLLRDCLIHGFRKATP